MLPNDGGKNLLQGHTKVAQKFPSANLSTVRHCASLSNEAAWVFLEYFWPELVMQCIVQI